MAQLDSRISRPNVSNPFQGAASPQIPDVTALFKDRKQANIFSTVAGALQMRREVERQEREDSLESKRFELESRKLDEQLKSSEQDRAVQTEELGLKKEELGLKKQKVDAEQTETQRKSQLAQLLDPNKYSNQDVISMASSGALTVDETKDILEARSFKTPEQKAESKALITAKKGLGDYADNAAKALIGLKQVDVAARELGDFKRGFFQQLGAKGKAVVDEASKDPKITKYKNSLNENLIQFARNIAEEKGPITNQDVERTAKALNDVTTPLQDKLDTLNRFRDRVVIAIKTKLDKAGMSMDEFISENPAVGELLSEAGFGGDSGEDDAFDAQTQKMMDEIDRLSESLKKQGLL